MTVNKSKLNIDNFVMYANVFYDYETHTDKDFLTKQIEYNKEIMQKLQNCQLPLDLMFQSV